tara:strand:+ start:421 stop:879 length:459 start_codon:yes stop_codon:yes gene_type:complete
MPYIKVSDLEDVKQLSKNLRKEDLDEIKANSNTNPYHALYTGVKFSHLPLTVMNDDRVVMIMGVIPQGKNLGMIWLLSSPEIKNISIAFLRNCKGVLDLYHKSFPVLYNYIDARNTVHLNWLKWLGFNFIKEHEKFGYEKRKFIEFVKCATQ